MSRKLRLLVIGNGASAAATDGTLYINRHTAEFLATLATEFQSVSFIEPREDFIATGNLHDFPLSQDLVRQLALDKRSLSLAIMSIARACWMLLTSSFVYIFFPGTLPRIVARICALTGKPYGIYLRGESFNVTEPTDRRIFSKARFVASVSLELAKAVRPLNERVIQIRPMLDLTECDATRRTHRPPTGDAWKILFVGRVEPSKGVPELIEAAEILRLREFPFRLWVVGGGPLHHELARRYTGDDSGHVNILGPIYEKDRLMAMYSDADFFVLPTHHEGFPRVLYEAMIKSNVILTTMVGGIPGLMRDGENCIAIPTQSPTEIADAILRVSADTQLRNTLATNGLVTVLHVLRDFPRHAQVVRRELRDFQP